MRWDRVFISGVLAAGLLCLGLTFMDRETEAAVDPTRGQNVIPLGAAISLSGRYGSNGRFVRDGYRFAVRTINSRGGVRLGNKPYKLSLMIEDDGSEAKRATAIVERLVHKKGVELLLGPYSTQVTQAVSPIAEKYHLPLVDAGAAGESLFERGYSHLFSVLTTTDRYMDDLFDIAEETAAPKLGKNPENITVGMAVYDDQFSRDLRGEVLSEIDKHHMRLVIDDRLPLDPTDLTMTLNRMKLLDPDIMVISALDAGAVAAVDYIERSPDVTVPMLVLAFCDTGRITNRDRKLANHVFCPMQWHASAPYHDDLFGTARQYAAKFKRVYGYDPTYLSATASAAIQVYAEAMEDCDCSDPKGVRDALAAIKLSSFYGPVQFDASGRNTAKPLLLMQLDEDGFVTVAPQALKTAEPQFNLDGRN